MRIIQLLKRSCLAIVGLLVAAAALDVATFDAQATQQDYRNLKHGLAHHYANLDWQVEHRKLDLARLDGETSARLDNSYSRLQAYLAFNAFIDAFNDPHLRLVRGEAARSIRVAGTTSSADGPARTSCSDAGYEDGLRAGAFAFSSLPGWNAIDSEWFATGLVGDLGILRIAEFGEGKYRGACEHVFDPALSERALQLATRAALQQELRRVISVLKSRGARRLAIDLTGNGGGSEWAQEAAALFSDRELSRKTISTPDPQCDRTPIWDGLPTCPIYPASDAEETIQGTGDWRGPVFLLVDSGSASATEEFAVWLRHSGVALLVGERTLGAGCGYIDGGKAVQLDSLPLHVMMPNCSRYGPDGRNEIEGLEPDIRFDWNAEPERLPAPLRTR